VVITENTMEPEKVVRSGWSRRNFDANVRSLSVHVNREDAKTVGGFENVQKVETCDEMKDHRRQTTRKHTDTP